MENKEKDLRICRIRYEREVLVGEYVEENSAAWIKDAMFLSTIMVRGESVPRLRCEADMIFKNFRYPLSDILQTEKLGDHPDAWKVYQEALNQIRGMRSKIAIAPSLSGVQGVVK